MSCIYDIFEVYAETITGTLPARRHSIPLTPAGKWDGMRTVGKNRVFRPRKTVVLKLGNHPAARSLRQLRNSGATAAWTQQHLRKKYPHLTLVQIYRMAS